MKIIVMKFGGTSVADINHIKKHTLKEYRKLYNKKFLKNKNILIIFSIRISTYMV